ncbi:MAG: hypothetical protein R3C02_01680 [Planctomycetaceae bacterium]
MASLIYEIQSPPFHKIGIMDIDQIFRRRPDATAMTLNNVLASPGFSGWMQEPLNIQRLLYTPEGKPYAYPSCRLLIS